MSILRKKIHLLHTFLHKVTFTARAHTHYSEHNRSANKKTAWTQLTCSIAVGVLGIGAWQNLDSCGNPTNVGLIASGVILSAIGSLVGGTRAQLCFSEKHSAHQHAAITYGELASDIIIFLTGDLSDVTVVTHFVEYIHGRIETADRTCPTAPVTYINEAKSMTPLPKSNGSVCDLSRCHVEIRKRMHSDVDLQDTSNSASNLVDR